MLAPIFLIALVLLPSCFSPKKVEKNKDYVLGQVIVAFESSVSEERIGEINKLLGTKIEKVMSSVRKEYLLRITNNASVLDVVDAYNELPEVKYAEPNYMSYIQSIP